MTNPLTDRLAQFQTAEKITSKGNLSVVLYLSRVAKERGLPLRPEELVTEREGQVKGLGAAVIKKILKEYGITRTLAEEAGRTSRGSMGLMNKYVALLNALNADGLAEMPAIESWWVDRIKDYFNARPFRLRFDASSSLRTIIRDLLAQAVDRQSENPGVNYAGIVLQHMVGAKLSLIMPPGSLAFHGASVADSPTDRRGDYILDDVVVHCTTAPAEALMAKCGDNLRAGLRPMIITVYQRVALAEQMAADHGLDGRIEILDFEQFIAGNVYELSKFRAVDRKVTVQKILEAYNAIVDDCETDPSLRVNLG